MVSISSTNKATKATKDDSDDHHGGRGFSLFTATIFIIGEVAGGGILSLPHAVAQAGWSGLAMITFCAASAGTAGLCLAESWLILEERYPRYRRGLTRKPFATIGYHAFGSYMSILLSVMMNVTRIGGTAVFLILSSQLFASLARSWIDLSICEWILIVAAILTVPLWLGSPADFWPIAYSAMISTTVGSILLIAKIGVVLSTDGFGDDFHFEGWQSFSTAFGTILFAFGGGSAFPNFQNDMREKRKFPKAVIFGFIGLLTLYLPVSALGYAAFGFSVHHDIIENLPQSSIITVIQLCFLVHCLTVVLLIINPVFLDLEELIKIPKPFNWKRCLFRTALVLLITFIGETFPNFGQILDLIGGSTMPLMAFVLPPLFYAKLCADRSNVEWPERRVPFYMRVIFAIIVVTGLVGGISATYSTLRNWNGLESACYRSMLSIQNINVTIVSRTGGGHHFIK